MEPPAAAAAAQKSLERLVSQRALQMSASLPCKMLVLGFFCGICFAHFFLAALAGFKGPELGGIFSATPTAALQKSNPADDEVNGSISSKVVTKEVRSIEDAGRRAKHLDDEKATLLYTSWSASLGRSTGGKGEAFDRTRHGDFDVPPGPHLENCNLMAQVNQLLDSYGENGSFPPWSTWKGFLRLKMASPISKVPKDETISGWRADMKEDYPPWIVGSDEDNFPLTRRVQRDLWIRQHPLNCSDPKIRFLVADWERIPGFGMGAQFAGMTGLLAIAINENRVLVTGYYNRADHEGCEGSSRSHWSCYFLPETSQECRDRAFKLISSREAWEDGIITVKENYTSKRIWSGHTPRVWGEPWNSLQPTTEIDGNLVMNHRKMDRRWWRAQAIRYLMRFQSLYTCRLLNVARHEAFGMQVAQMVVRNLDEEWPEVGANGSQPAGGMEALVWSVRRPWTPRPLMSMHVRMGDKACEMKVVDFHHYMHLARRIRARFPDLRHIWLSTEMQEVVEKSGRYAEGGWRFYYTKVARQVGNGTMASYEAALGRETSTNYPLVNFLMASDADFFVGALGSTWCFLIDAMRNTAGKVSSGYLSVNKDRFW